MPVNGRGILRAPDPGDELFARNASPEIRHGSRGFFVGEVSNSAAGAFTGGISKRCHIPPVRATAALAGRDL